jgi:hypothetical protein
MNLAPFNEKTLIGAFWTASQRQAHSLHEVSYRACFKPQLPEYFINQYTAVGDVIYDPFSGRGTTALQAVLMGRSAIANDVNPLSERLVRPRIIPPTLEAIQERLESIHLAENLKADIDLSMFYHPTTESHIVSLQRYLQTRRDNLCLDVIDEWINMVATNHLTGHSSGFFSVYTFPPNQAVSATRQTKINQQRKQTPDYRDIKKIILKKSKSLLRSEIKSKNQRASAVFLTGDARHTSQIQDNSVDLVVTSPPFLDVIQYADDNWLRLWFNRIPTPNITMSKTVAAWSVVMLEVFIELYRVCKPSAHVAFEVGEVKKGKIKLDEVVLPLAEQAGFTHLKTLINTQAFTKTANIWGVKNNEVGTNSNRIVLLQK